MKKFFVLCSLLVFNCLYSQSIKSVDTLEIKPLGQELGLLQLNVKEMALDDLGYLWAGTEDGLHRFNGYEFLPYLHNPKDSTSIKDDHIRSLLYTRDTLWIATSAQGISSFIPSQNSFFNPKIGKTNLDVNTSYKILELNDNNLLFSVKNNIVVYNRTENKSTLIKLPKTERENYVTDIVEISDDTYWLSTNTGGILKLYGETLEIEKSTYLTGKSVSSFYKLKDKILIGTTNGLYEYDLLDDELKETSLNLSVKCFYKFNESQFFIGTQNGLFSYQTVKSEIKPITLKSNNGKIFNTVDINHIIGDKKENMWIGTEALGIFHYSPFQKKFKTLKISQKEYPFLNNTSTFQFIKDVDSTLWIGSRYGLIKYFHKKNQFKYYDLKERPLIYTIERDQNNIIWAGGFNSGLLKYNSKSDSFEKIKNGNLPDNDIVEIIAIDSNTLWVCTWSGGIHSFNIEKEVFEEVLIHNKRINRARSSLIDSNRNIWLGTDQGSYKISNNGVIDIYNDESKSNLKLSGNRVFDIKEDSLGNIWFGTNVGLTKLDVINNKTFYYYKQKGLPNDFIYSVLISSNNDVWVSTNFGISVLDYKSNTFRNYSTSDGLQNNEFNGKAGYQDEFGNFYFGGILGINIFHPEKILQNKYIPDTHIESVELFNKQIQRNELYKDTLEFRSDENVITFNYTALNFLNPEKCNYTYKMEGFDSEWRPITKNRSTTYTNLNPGNYTFKVKSSNDVGVWNDTPKIMKIVIIPPWYQTTFFKIGFLIFFLLSGILFYFYKTMKLKTDKLKLEGIIAQRTHEILGKNKALKLAYNEAENQKESIKFLMKELTHRVKNNLQIISSLLNIQANTLESKPAIEALKMAKNRILAISHIENKIMVEKETVFIDQFIEELSNSVITALADDQSHKFNIVYDLDKVSIKSINTTMIGLIINELITNTTKYAFDVYKNENELKIVCKIEGDSIKLIISDNGKGYDVKKDVEAKSLGIELVTEMVEQLNGTIRINSNNGVENIITFPR